MLSPRSIAATPSSKRKAVTCLAHEKAPPILGSPACLRYLGRPLRSRTPQAQRRSIFELYIQEVARAIGKIVKRSPDPIKREFLRLADEVTEQDLATQDAALEEASRKNAARPRRAQEEDE